jgi:branched-chain amino acid transport system ATP-binding protein
MLEVQNLRVHYGKIAALRDISLNVEKGEIVSVVGPNGAGKSTLLRTIAGLRTPSAGAITFEGRSLVGSRPEDIVRRGIALVPEGRRVLTTLTVEENLRIGASNRRDRTEADRDVEAAIERFPILGVYRSSPAGRLSGGEQQQLVIARALMSRPRLLLLDEPSLGLAPLVVARVFEFLQEISEEGVTIVLVEQQAARAMRFADRTYVLASGEVRIKGVQREILQMVDVETAYFGTRPERNPDRNPR